MKKLFNKIVKFFKNKTIEKMVDNSENEYKNTVAVADKIYKIEQGLLLHSKHRGTEFETAFGRPSPEEILWLIREQPQRASKLSKFINKTYTVNELKLNNKI